MAKQRIVNANPRVGRRGAEDRGPVEFSDRYKGPQTRLQTEKQRTEQKERSASREASITRSDKHKEAVTSPRLATERTTQTQQATITPASRPVLRETFPRGEVEPPKKKEKKAFAGGPGGFFIENDSGTHNVGGDTRRRASR